MTQEFLDRIELCLNTSFELRYGRKIPHPDRIALRDGGVLFEGAVLYADVVGSTKLGDRFGFDGTAKIMQAFVLGCGWIARQNGGDVTAYDGDRIMAVFGGPDQEGAAVTTAFEICYFVRSILNPGVNRLFGLPPMVKRVRHCCGIDGGDMLAVKMGLRGNTDLFWSGRPANFAAKMCANRSPFYPTVISAKVFQQLPDDLKRNREGSFWRRFACPQVGMSVLGSQVSFPF